MFQAAEEERTQALAGFGAAMGEHPRVPGGRLAVDSWESALRALDASRNGGLRRRGEMHDLDF
jgi:hypothetical protein